jgi:AAA domain, putative AbiEii toxin, Type IV TA system
MDPRDEALFEAVLDLLTDRDGTKEDPLLPGVREIEVTPDRTWVLGPGDRRVPLSALSDGYLTTLGWLVDFLARWLEYARRNDYEIGPGFAAEMPAVVLVDEIDLHLHPRWQMRVVPALARTFPRTTFIATTHNPLTLSGMVGDERMRGAVHIIKERADGNLEIIQRDLEPGMSADEVLTHEWFGLRSTLDRDTLELLDEHRALLRQDVAEDHPRRRELEAELRRRLGSYADTPAERLAQHLVAKQFPDDVPEMDDLSDEERDRLSELYEAAVAKARSEGKSPPEQP